MVIVLAIGLLLNFYELSVHAQKEAGISSEIRGVAERAADLLVYSPDVTCVLYESSGGSATNPIMNLPNCLSQAGSKKVTKARLGIPAGFSCDIDAEGEAALALETGAGGCNGNPAAANEVVVINREVFVASDGSTDRILKEGYLECLKGNCSEISGAMHGPFTVTLKVWK